jgi:Flp pilus assembly protein TadD
MSRAHGCRAPFWTMGLFLGLLGCAGNPATPSQVSAPAPAPASRAESDKSDITVPERRDVNADVRADFDAAMAQLALGEYEKGIQLLNKVASRSPEHTAPYVNLAIAYQKTGDLARAEENVKKALALNPAHPIASNEYGLIFRRTGRFAEAREIYERTLKRYPGFLPARKNLGILCDLYLRDLDCALVQYRAYSAAAPDDKNVKIWIADLEKRLGKSEP